MRWALLLISIAASAAEKKRNPVDEACALPLRVAPLLNYCSDNAAAVNAANACFSALDKMWKDEPLSLSAAFGALNRQNDGQQTQNFADTGADLQNTVDRLRFLVRTTQEKTALLARIPLVMVDYPGAALDPKLSAPCYTDRARAIQDLVSKLDDKILQGKAALGETAKLGGAVTSRGANLGAGAGTGSGLHLVTPGARAQARPVPLGKSPAPTSDITGVRDRQNKDGILDGFPSGGPLSK